MSDARRRAAERDAARGDVGAAALALRERVRAGELAPERLRLAARLGHADAAVALDLAREELDLPSLAAVIAEAGEEPAERAALAAAWRGADHPSAPDDFRPALLRATEFTTCPCADHARALLGLEIVPAPLAELDRAGFRIGAQDQTAALVAVVARRARRLVEPNRSTDGREPLAPALRRMLEGARLSAVEQPVPEVGRIDDWADLGDYGERARAWWEQNEPAAARAIGDLVRAEVAAWALGEEDPLAGKVDDRIRRTNGRIGRTLGDAPERGSPGEESQ